MDYQNPQSFSNPEYSQNIELSPNLSQIPTSTEIPTSKNVTQNLFGDAQQANKKKRTSNNVSWVVKEDLALMSSWVYASVDSVRGKHQKGDALWVRVKKLYHEAQAENQLKLTKEMWIL